MDAGAAVHPGRRAQFPYRDAGVRVPTLAEVLWTLPRMPVLLEMKEPEAQEAVRRVLLEEGAASAAWWRRSTMRRSGLFREPPFAGGGVGRRDRGRSTARCCSAGGPARRRYRMLSVPLRYRGLPVPTRRFVAAARGLGCPVHVWTVNDPATARRLWARGVAGIVTNRPAAIAAQRAPTS